MTDGMVSSDLPSHCHFTGQVLSRLPQAVSGAVLARTALPMLCKLEAVLVIADQVRLRAVHRLCSGLDWPWAGTLLRTHANFWNAGDSLP